MKTTHHPSVWVAITDTPQEAASMKARAKLMMELSEMINTRKLRQKDAISEGFLVVKFLLRITVAGARNPAFAALV